MNSISKYLYDIRSEPFLRTSLEEVDHSGFSLVGSRMKFLIITITFNNPNLVRHQSKLMDKFLQDNFLHLVVDNSNNAARSKEILETCRDVSRAYVKLPPNPFKKPSASHSLALNWCVRHIIKTGKPEHFGFIDHDIYPVKPDRILPILERQKIFGLLQERKSIWYLWAGFCFFQFAAVQTCQLNFFPGSVDGVGVDTGGQLFREIFSNMDRNNIFFPSQSYGDLREGNVPQSDKVEFIGNWMHSFNGSYWMPVPDKEKELQRMIEKFLRD